MHLLFLSLLIAFSALLSGRVWEGAFPPHGKQRMVMAALAFSLLDALLLLALPWLKLSFGAVGLPLFIAIIGRLAVTLIANLVHRWHLKTGLGSWLALNALMSAVIGYGLYVEPFALGVTALELRAPSLRGGPVHPEAATVRIVHLTDLHIERITRREREMLAQVAELEPDLLLLTGDYLNLDYLDDPQARQDARAVLAELASLPVPYGIYAVNGTVDTPQIMAELFDGLDIHVLDDAVATVKLCQPGECPAAAAISIIGISDRHNQAAAATALDTLAAGMPTDSTRVLLYHTPDLIETAAQNGIALYLAGHTHGGQVRLPGYGALVTFSAYGKQYEMGRYQVSDTTLYVSRGLGMEGFGMPRARFLCPPEIVLIALKPP
ncbi:MAG: metallophosphoesterase [Chloroflexota bacterium]